MFVRYARDFCRQNRMISAQQVPPVILQREVSTTAWLRTGLTTVAGDLGSEIPRSHLIASCEQVLRPRREVVKAVHDKLREFAPDKASQYELLLADQRSVQRLMDETLNVEGLVTADSAEKLLDEMRRATAQEVHDEYDRRFRRQAQRHGQQKRELEERAAANLLAEQAAAAAALAEGQRQLQENAQRLAGIEAEGERLRTEAFAARTRDVRRVDEAIAGVNGRARLLERILLLALWLPILAAFAGGTLGLGTNLYAVVGSAAFVALIGVYHTVQEVRQKPKFGFQNILDAAARAGFRKRLVAFHLDRSTYESAVEIDYGKVRWRPGARDNVIALPPPETGNGKT